VLSAEPIDADTAVANGFAFSKAGAGEALDAALALARRIAVHPLPAVVANKQLLRHGRATAIEEVWRREKAAMQAITEQLGPIGWERG